MVLEIWLRNIFSVRVAVRELLQNLLAQTNDYGNLTGESK